MVAKTLTFAMFAAHQAIRPAFEAAKFMLRTRTTLAPSAANEARIVQSATISVSEERQTCK